MAETLHRLRSWLVVLGAALLLPMAGISAASAQPTTTDSGVSPMIVGGTRASTS